MVPIQTHPAFRNFDYRFQKWNKMPKLWPGSVAGIWQTPGRFDQGV